MCGGLYKSTLNLYDQISDVEFTLNLYDQISDVEFTLNLYDQISDVAYMAIYIYTCMYRCIYKPNILMMCTCT